MRKLLTYLFVSCLMHSNAWAQEVALQAPPSSGESIVLQCDREIYGLNEEIHFHASYNAPKELRGASWSSVLYVELIAWDGTKQAASKVLILNGGATGKIRIPENIASGVYYLRAYTLWMRNYSPKVYAYLPLKILNPYSQEIFAGPHDSLTNFWSMDHTDIDIREGLVLTGLKNQYACREQVDFDIQIPEDLKDGSYSLGIAKTHGPSSAEYKVEALPDMDQESVKLEFLPEINGITLSGRVVDGESNEPVLNTRMQVSSYASPFFFAEVPTGKDGSFLYSLPHFSGNPELHIMEVSEASSDHKILLSSEFCNKPVRLPYEPLRFDSIEKSIVKEILVNTQLKDRYRTNVGAVSIDLRDSVFQTFYGSEATTTYVRDYIELSNLREFIYEIIPQVSILSNSNGSSISIQGPSCMDIYPPLLLMDNVPVPNNEELLNIPSSRIERIEVLNQAYMVGNTRYSGILSIYSTKKDMSGMAQEGTRHFFNFHMLDNRNPLSEKMAVEESSAPDIRNLLCWTPRIELSDEGASHVSFSTPDMPGNYFLTLFGTDSENRASVLIKAMILVK